MPQKIFIIEDDHDLLLSLETALRRAGYEVEVCRDFTEAERELLAYQPDLILLDLNLPRFNGFHWCTRIRQQTDIPIMMISGLVESKTQVLALELGADEYLEKPFRMELLIAKLRALLRRAYDYEASAEQKLLNSGDLQLDLSTLTLRGPYGEAELSRNEFKMMQSLMQAAGHYVTRDELAEQLWGHGEFISENTLNVNISRLRAKVRDLTGRNLLLAKKNLGYRLLQDEEDV